jgi:hypothetical protein
VTLPVEPGAPDPERDTKMTGVYLGAIAVEAAIILGLWVFGRMFS